MNKLMNRLMLIFVLVILVILVIIIILTLKSNTKNHSSFDDIEYKLENNNNLISRLDDYDNTNKFIYFVHISKTSGLYISKILKEYLYYGHIKNKSTPYFPHEPPKYIPEINFKNFLCFTVVRNPYNRFLSTYNFQKYSTYKNNFDFKKEEYDDVNVFINNYLGDIENKNKNFQRKYYFVPQVEYLHDYYGNKIDNVLHFENIKEEFNNFAKKNSIDVEYDDTDYVNKAQLINTTFKDLNENSKEILKKFYYEDFITFGYSF